MELATIAKQVRRCKNTLTIAGYGIIVLIIWDFIKSAIYVNWIFPTIKESLNHTLMIVFIVFSIAELIYCLISGLIISKHGKNDKKISIPILIVSAILLLFASACVGFSISVIVLPEGINVIFIINLIDDIIFLVFTIRIFLSIIRLIKLNKFLKEHSNEC